MPFRVHVVALGKDKAFNTRSLAKLINFKIAAIREYTDDSKCHIENK